MKKILSFCLVMVPLFVLPTVVMAQVKQQDQNGIRQNPQETTINKEVVVTPQDNQVQSQNQVKTQNQGEEFQLQVTTQHMEQLMDMKGLSEETGNKVKAIAQEQVQTQTQIQTQLNKLKSKSGLMKKLFGPDYGAIKNLKQQMEQNQLRIKQLEQLQTQVVNLADQTQIEEAVQALLEQNTALQDQIQAEEQVGSVFGWLIRLFVK